MGRPLYLGKFIFTQSQAMLLLSCDPYRDHAGIHGNQRIVVRYLIEHDFIESKKYDNGDIYYQLTAKGRLATEGAQPHG